MAIYCIPNPPERRTALHSTALARWDTDLSSWVLGRGKTPIFGSTPKGSRSRSSVTPAHDLPAEGTEPDTGADSQSAPRASKLDQ